MLQSIKSSLSVNINNWAIVTICLIAFLCFISCSSDKQDQLGVTKIALTTEMTTFELSKVYESLEVIPLEGAAGILIGQVRNVMFTDELIVVFDNLQERLFCFKPDGSYEYSIDAQGDGPMEYVSITDFTINEDRNTIEIYSFKQGKIVGYDLSTGVPKYNFRFNYYLREFTWLSTNEYLIYSPDLENSQLGNGQKIEKGVFTVSTSGAFLRQIEVSNKADYAQPMNALSGYGKYAFLVSGLSKNVYEFVNGKVVNDFVLQISDAKTDVEYAVPFSVSGTVETQLVEYGIPNGSIKTLLFQGNEEVEDFVFFRNDIFKFPLKPQFVDQRGRLIDLLTYDKYVAINENLSNLGEVGFYDKDANEYFSSSLKGFNEQTNPILIRLSLK